MNTITFAVLVTMTGSASAMCFSEASREYGVPEALLRAHAIVESRNNPSATNQNTDGSTDLGLMQINSSWLPKLSKWGITRNRLLNDACMNIKVAAWVIAANIKQYGYNWTAVGAYNVGCKKLSAAVCQSRRNVYAKKIYVALGKIDHQYAPGIASGAAYVPTSGIRSVRFTPVDSYIGRES